MLCADECVCVMCFFFCKQKRSNEMRISDWSADGSSSDLTAAEHNEGPIAFRYPRGNGVGVPLPEVPEKLEIGKGRVVRSGKTVAILSLGTRLAEALKAADTLEARDRKSTRLNSSH